MNDRKNTTGSVLGYVLLIMLVVLIVATTVTAIMIRNLQVTTSYSHSARSYYAAESGLERALHYLQWARDEKTVGAQATATTIEGFTDTFSFGANYDVSASVADDAFSVDLATQESQQWDIFSEDNTVGYRLIPLPNLDNIGVSWNESSSCTAGTSQIDVSFSSWTQFRWEDISNPSTLVTSYVVSCPGFGNGFDCNGYILGVDASHLYKVRVKALNCAIEDVTVRALDTSGATISTANLVQLSSQGNFGTTQRTVEAQTIWRAPIQRYFDFVLFSEDPIIK